MNTILKIDPFISSPLWGERRSRSPFEDPAVIERVGEELFLTLSDVIDIMEKNCMIIVTITYETPELLGHIAIWYFYPECYFAFLCL